MPQNDHASQGRAARDGGAPRRRSKEVITHAGWQALKAAAGLLAAVLFVAFLRAPLEYDLLPYLIKQFGHPQALYLYNAAGTHPDDQYDLLIPPSVLASGRMVQMQVVADREKADQEVRKQEGADPQKAKPRNFIVHGARSGNMLGFTYISSSDKVGLGTFVGKRLDQDEDIYLGTLTGLGHSKDGDCRIITYWAVLGPKERSDGFAAKLNGRGAPGPADASNSVSCNG